MLAVWWLAVLPLAYHFSPSPRRGLLEGLVLAAGSFALASWRPLATLVREATPMSRLAVGGLLALSILAQTQQANARYYPASAFDMYGVARQPTLEWSRLRLVACDGQETLGRMDDLFPTIGYDLGTSLTGNLLAYTQGADSLARAQGGSKARALLESAGRAHRAKAGKSRLCALAAELATAPVDTPWDALAALPKEVMRVDLSH